VYKIYSS